MKILGGAALVAAAVLLAACSSSSSGRVAGTDNPVVSAAPASGSAGSSTPPFPVTSKVASGPLGGDWCASTSAWWVPRGSTGIEVHVEVPGVAELSVQAVDAGGNPLGDGSGQVDDGSTGTTIDVPAPVSKVAGVSLAVAGSEAGICAVTKA